ncbi:MAG: PorT family protein [Sphingobacteriaceae bacterium]|nr:MAG: PorT family protein [Sphingobacteriaceae bacterium]
MLLLLKPVLHHKAVPYFTYFFLFTVLICFLPGYVIAQNDTGNSSKATNFPDDKFEIGLSGGLSLNRFTKDQPQTGFNTGFVAGALIKYKIYKLLSLQLEANVLQQGGQMIRFKDDTRYGLPEGFNNQNVKNSSYILNSIEIPVLLNYTFKIKQTWKPALYAGGSYAYTFNVTETYQKTGNLLPGEDIIATVNGSQNATGAFNSSRLNFIVGANVKLPLYATLKLLLDFRYLSGLTAARDNYSYMEKVGFGSDIFTNSFVTKIGLILPLAN